MTLKLTQKETSLLKDQQNHEKICIQKYQTYASQASDPQLKQLLNTYAQQEQQHLNTINQMLSGQVPTMTSSSSQSNQESGMQSSAMSSATSSSTTSSQAATNSQSDSALCNDMLMTEKFVSGAYDTAIFECADTNIRQALNHIQKEEQGHGEGLFQYMQSKGMYNTQ
ncbi:MAG: Coat domain protein [Firmicutes bacterium]|nr:Coat domain protein [Bacillota bacterium]